MQQEKQKQKAAALEGNLALKFLMNPKELSRIVNYKDKKRQSLMPEPKTLSPPDSMMLSSTDAMRGSMDFSPTSNGGGAG